MVGVFPNLSGRAAECQFPGHGFGRKSNPSNRGHHPRLGVRFLLGPAKNDHDPINGPQAAGQPDHDAVDDAAVDCGVFVQFPHRSGNVLDCFKYCGRRNTILHNRVATSVPAVSQTGRGARANSIANIDRPLRGECEKWKYE